MDLLTSEKEGVIKYRLQHNHAILDTAIAIAEINAWRTIMHRLGLIGQDSAKYAGLGYGNISQRFESCGFIVSGTQTGHLACLNREHYCMVLDADAQSNSLHSLGPCQPSSEALTHAVLYQQLNDVNCVIHVHCKEIWRHAAALHLSSTAADIRYGTPEMANAVQHLLRTPQCLSKQIFTMRGHEDGVVAFGANPKDAAQRLIGCLAEALIIAS